MRRTLLIVPFALEVERREWILRENRRKLNRSQPLGCKLQLRSGRVLSHVHRFSTQPINVDAEADLFRFSLLRRIEGTLSERCVQVFVVGQGFFALTPIRRIRPSRSAQADESKRECYSRSFVATLRPAWPLPDFSFGSHPKSPPSS